MKQVAEVMPEVLLSVTDAARCLGISEGTVRLWSDSGRPASLRTGNGTRVFRPAP